MKRIALLTTITLAAATLSTGCYGHTRSTKRTSHVVNAAMGVVGVLLAVTVEDDGDCTGHESTCLYDFKTNRVVAAPFIGWALIGTILNLGTPTDLEAPPPLPTSAPGLVTAPGLQPATIVVR